MAEAPDTSTTDWIQPPREQEGLQRFVETIRERFWMIVLTVAITTGVALLYVFTATKIYHAEADVLVTPVTGDDPVLISLGLIHESVDPTRDVETASRLITNADVAARVKSKLHTSDSQNTLLSEVSAEPIAQSNIVAITASETSPKGAQDLANAFADAAIADRAQQLHGLIDDKLPSLEAQAAAATSTDAANAINAQIAQLQILRSGPDPTMRVETRATLPTRQASPRPVLSVAAGIVAGLILGVGGAFALQVLDPRLRREEQLRRLYRLPILGRIPLESRRRSASKPLIPQRLSPAGGEAYRTLRTTLAGRRSGRGRVIMVTGSSPSEGKTTTAINLATSLALAGRRVILIESDVRRPVIGDALGAQPENGGVISVLIENHTLEEALTTSATYGPNLQLLLADYEGGGIAELFSISSAEQMIEEARQMADWVIIDSPPLNEVVDALPLAQLSDDILLVVRLGITRLAKLSQLGELLAENGIRPTGFAVVGIPPPKRSEYHYYPESPDGPSEPRRRQLVSTSESDT